jgi:hypothetical protein
VDAELELLDFDELELPDFEVLALLFDVVLP